MKITISIPDELSRAVERHAKSTQKSRSQLCTDALNYYLLHRAPDEITQAMNRVINQIGDPSPDPVLDAAARIIFERTEW